jgi:hypothetical protein
MKLELSYHLEKFGEILSAIFAININDVKVNDFEMGMMTNSRRRN